MFCQEKLISKKHKKVSKILNCIKHLLILASVLIGCVSISAFTSLVVIPIGIGSSAVGIKIFVITAVIKNYKPVIQKKKIKKHDKIVLAAKT